MTVHVLHEQELPMPAPQVRPPVDPNSMGIPTPPAPRPAAPQNVPAIYGAIAQALVGRIHGLLLILSAIAAGIIVVSDPSVLRLYAGGGYLCFTLAGLYVLRK